MSNSKCLIIGDTHFDSPFKGYLDNQVETCLKLIDSSKPKYVVFLGDIYHHRKPHPEVIVKVARLFKKISLTPGLTKVFILRGNHDSANKSDDGLTALETLEWSGSKVSLISQTQFDEDLNFLFIPHYENEATIKESLCYIKDKDTVVFGHFGYQGCMNSGGFMDFGFEKGVFKNRTILGHIHRYKDDGNVLVLGTPWSTNFGECDYDHFTGTITQESPGVWSPLVKKAVEFGPRYYVCPFESLEQMKEEIQDPRYFTILRVLMDKFTEEGSTDTRNNILEEYKVKHVDIKFQPIFDKKLDNRISNFDPNIPVQSIHGDMIRQYLEEQASTIPQEDLEKGLDIISDHENKTSEG